jgi:hypothetical protein
MLLKTKIKIKTNIMELGNNKPGNYGRQDINKLALSESERLMNKERQQAQEAAKFSAIIGPTLDAVNAFDQRGQTVGNKIDIHNNEVSVNGEKVSHEEVKKYGVYLGDHVGDINSVSTGSNFEGVINTGDNATIDDIKIPDFVGEHSYKSEDYHLDDDSFTVPSFGQTPKVDYSNRSINIQGSVIGGNIVMGNVGGYINYNSKPDSEPYSLKGDQIIQDDLGPLKKESKPEYIPEQLEDPWLSNSSELPISPKEKAIDELPELSYEVIKDGPEQFNSMDDVFAQMVKNWEKQYGVEPIPKLEPDSSNMEEIIDVINRNWETKYANLLDKKANQEPPQKEVKEVLRKRDKIKNVLKAVGTKIKDNLDKWSQKLDNFIYEDEPEVINNPSYYVETDTRSSEEKLSDSIKTINDNQRSNRYVQNGQSAFGVETPEMKARRQKINEIKAKRIENQNTETPKKDTESYIVPQSQIDYVNQQDSITIPDNKSQKPEIKDEPLPFELIDNNSDQMDIKDQEKFIKDRMDSIDKLMTVEELENEIANIENGTISIPDAVADESDYEGTDEEVTEKLNKNKEYTEARDINMLKTAEVLTALRQKKELLSTGIDLENLSGPSKAIYESRTFTLFNMSGKLVGMIGKSDDISTGRTAEQLPATVDDKGRLVVTEPNGKQYVVTDIKSKIIAQKTEEIKKQLNSRIENL